MPGTEALFREDAYLSTLEATLLRVEPDGGLVFDRTNFYATAGGQPGDTGSVELPDGRQIRVVDTVWSPDKLDVVMRTEAGADLPEPGRTLVLHLDWARRYKLMRMHTACHLLSVVCPYPITGASVGEEESRVDFDISDSAADKAAVTSALMELVNANHPVGLRWITDEELDADPGLVKSKNVKPPRGTGRIRLVTIGEGSSVDAQPCGGTHVSETQEVGEIHIGKIEKKGRENRRFRIRFGQLPPA
jgi:misacylated tRNA(Ala) deacylase